VANGPPPRAWNRGSRDRAASRLRCRAVARIEAVLCNCRGAPQFAEMHEAGQKRRAARLRRTRRGNASIKAKANPETHEIKMLISLRQDLPDGVKAPRPFDCDGYELRSHPSRRTRCVFFLKAVYGLENCDQREYSNFQYCRPKADLQESWRYAVSAGGPRGLCGCVGV